MGVRLCPHCARPPLVDRERTACQLAVRQAGFRAALLSRRGARRRRSPASAGTRGAAGLASRRRGSHPRNACRRGHRTTRSASPLRGLAVARRLPVPRRLSPAIARPETGLESPDRRACRAGGRGAKPAAHRADRARRTPDHLSHDSRGENRLDPLSEFRAAGTRRSLVSKRRLGSARHRPGGTGDPHGKAAWQDATRHCIRSP